MHIIHDEQNLSYIQHPPSMNAVLLPTTHTNNIFIYYIDNIWQHHMRVMKEPSLLHFFFRFKKKEKKNHFNWTTPPKCQECFSNLMYPHPQLSPMWVLPSLSTQAIWSPLHYTHIIHINIDILTHMQNTHKHTQ